MSDDITCTSCNTLDIGTLIKEDDTVTTLTLRGEQQSADTLKKVEELARDVESDPCTISTESVENGEATHMELTFSCAAEKLIFEMRLRSVLR